MSSTLLLRLQAPMQAWGVQSLFSSRDTCREPTKSGVIGLLCCALGRHRTEPLDDLTSLRMGIRIDQEGHLLKDFQTARNIMNALGNPGTNIISDRFYLCDAIFLVGLESQDIHLLTRLWEALQHPKWLLYLGRRAFPPAKPIWLRDGLQRDEALTEALNQYPYLGSEKAYQQIEQLRVLMEDPAGSITQQDTPLFFETRSFALRSQSLHYFSKPPSILKEAIDVS
jgi:CRISPR system Cascade subunit CasD